MATNALPGQKESPLETLKAQLDQWEHQIREELKELELLIEQGQGEVERLGRRSTGALDFLDQAHKRGNMEAVLDLYPKALEAQQRYFIMRGQLEKMEGERDQLQRLVEFIGGIRQQLIQMDRSEEGRSPLKTVETIVQAQEEERRRLSRQMHDGPAQALSNFILQSEIALRLFDRDPDAARGELQNLKTAATKTFQEVREFIFQLRPMMLDDLGLVPTVRRYLDMLSEQTGADIEVQVTGSSERRLAPYEEVFLFRALQELAANALHRGEATKVRVSLEITPQKVVLRVEDNGKGFDTATLSESEGMGLRLLNERVGMMGGALEIQSRPGQGTQAMLSIPVVLTQ